MKPFLKLPLIWCALFAIHFVMTDAHRYTQILVHAVFNPVNVAAVAHKLDIPISLFFMGCPGPHFPHAFEDFGTRIVSL
jgi:hypothetical protein